MIPCCCCCCCIKQIKQQQHVSLFFKSHGLTDECQRIWKNFSFFLWGEGRRAGWKHRKESRRSGKNRRCSTLFLCFSFSLLSLWDYLSGNSQIVLEFPWELITIWADKTETFQFDQLLNAEARLRFNQWIWIAVVSQSNGIYGSKSN